MMELLTASGVSISLDPESPHRDMLHDLAANALGGIVVEAETNDSDEIVAKIIAERVAGTALTTFTGGVYTLTPQGDWLFVSHDGGFTETIDAIDIGYDDIATATMPGGWSWKR